VSSHDVELVRRSVEAFARGDFETFFAGLAPAVEWTTSADEPDPQTYRGLEGIRRFVADLEGAWLDRFGARMQFKDFIDADGWVVVPWTAALEGRTSGFPVEVNETYAVRIEDDRIVEVHEYRTAEEALEACGARPA
jgi:ketosteroid isomerase-like protein